MIHPFFCYLYIFLSFLLSFLLFIPGHVRFDRYFYLPVVLLITLYTIHAMVTDKQVYTKRSFQQSCLTASGKYLFWGLVLLAIIALYSSPLYRDMTTETRRFFKDFLRAFAVCGWPYFFLADQFRYSLANTVADQYMTTSVLLRCLMRGKLTRFWRRLTSRPSKRMFVSAALRVHFVPVMAEQVSSGITNFVLRYRAQAAQLHLAFTEDSLQTQQTFFAVLFLLTVLAWLVDSNNATMGYFWESRFTKTRFREMDPYLIHWVITLSCYVPFIFLVNNYLVTFPHIPDGSAAMFTSVRVNLFIDVTMTAALLLYMASGSALAFSFSNLSYKRIQTRGPYRFIRHPSITFKIIWFSLAFYRFSAAYTFGWFLCYLTWMGIYVVRAFVEERFLRRFPEYQAYMQQTKYRFIPGII